MKNWSKVVLGAAALALTATTAAYAAPAAQLQPPKSHVRAHVVPAAAVDTAKEAKYTAIAPCRIADTRLTGGAIASGHSRSFYAVGTSGFGAQGGESCDIPYAATAVTGSVIATKATGTGYLRVFAYGASLPTASFLNFNKTLTLSASGTIPITANGTRNFTVLASGASTQVVIQLTGYYIPATWAEVNASGGYVAGSRVVSVSHLDFTGTYQVDFDRDVSGCAYQATPSHSGNNLRVEPIGSDARAVFVMSTDRAGALADTQFYLTVTC